MKRGDIVIILVAVTLAIVAARVIFPEEIGNAINEVIDMLVVLTTTEEHRLSQLEPETQAAARQFLQAMANKGYQVEVGRTLGTAADTARNREKGTTAIAEGSHSWHEIARALDVYPVDPATGVADRNGVNNDLFIEMHQTAAQFGFRNIAYDEMWQRKYINTSKGKVWDGGHLEFWGPYSSKSAAIAAEGSNYGIG